MINRSPHRLFVLVFAALLVAPFVTFVAPAQTDSEDETLILSAEGFAQSVMKLEQESDLRLVNADRNASAARGAISGAFRMRSFAEDAQATSPAIQGVRLAEVNVSELRSISRGFLLSHSTLLGHALSAGNFDEKIVLTREVRNDDGAVDFDYGRRIGEWMLRDHQILVHTRAGRLTSVNGYNVPLPSSLEQQIAEELSTATFVSDEELADSLYYDLLDEMGTSDGSDYADVLKGSIETDTKEKYISVENDPRYQYRVVTSEYAYWVDATTGEIIWREPMKIPAVSSASSISPVLSDGTN